MSGELRLEGPGIGNLVASLATLTESAPSADFAAIGGLAVLARLGGAHRVTDDLDTVATQHGDEPTVVEAVIAAQGTDGALNGTKVDCIAVGDVPAAELSAEHLPDVEEDRIFVLAHRWALDTADELTLVAETDGTIVARVRCRFAPPRRAHPRSPPEEPQQAAGGRRWSAWGSRGRPGSPGRRSAG